MAATAIARHGAGVLLQGPSGAGKSDLALRALSLPVQLPGEDGAVPFQLISDDQTIVRRCGAEILASPPGPIRNLIEVRGVGIIAAAAVADVPVRLVVALSGDAIDRLPDWPGETTTILGCVVERTLLDPFEASAHIKLALLLRRAAHTAAETRPTVR